MPDPLRVLVGSHSHPRVQNGGSEVASHALFERLAAEPGFAAEYLGCARGTLFQRAGQAITQPFARNDHLYTVGDFEGFKFANRDMAFPRDFRALLRAFDPHVVHLHHYVNFGMEALFHVRDTLPDARLVLTLHEFLAICHQQGQMVKRHTNALCFGADPVSCARCFPEAEPPDFFLRQLFVQRFLDCVDQIVAPSRFLAGRYVEWGIPHGRIAVIENVPRSAAPPASIARQTRPGRLTVGFFGQISELKGMDVLLDAVELLREDGRTDIGFSIHGDHTNQPPAYQAQFLQRIAAAGSTVSFRGAYGNSTVDSLMASVDLVVVPSVWWENSPVVIQEAFRNGRAVLCSDIGGMAEKVVPGETGAHFAVGSARALADALLALADDPVELARLGDVAAARWNGRDAFDAHLALYRAVLAGRDAEAVPVGASPSHRPPVLSTPAPDMLHALAGSARGGPPERPAGPEAERIGAAAPGSAPPGDALLRTALPGDAAPGTALPETALPEDVPPGTALPRTALPETALPGDAPPETAPREAALPETVLPGDARPGTALPGDAPGGGGADEVADGPLSPSGAEPDPPPPPSRTMPRFWRR